VSSAVGLVLVASLVAAPVALRSDEAPPPPARGGAHARAHSAQARPAAPAVPAAAIVGDSYTSGANASSPTRGYAERLARAMGWKDADIRGLPGAGYVRPSVHGHYLRTVLRKVVKRAPPIVVLVMGHNDTRVDPLREERSARRTLAMVRRRLPLARIVVVGPIWQSGDPLPRVYATRDAIFRAVRAVGHLRWIDPLAERWFTGDKRLHTGNATRFISSDDNHPNDAGHAHIARMLTRDLGRFGIHPAAS
jgi:lysophospholipase L1-like esterase